MSLSFVSSWELWWWPDVVGRCCGSAMAMKVVVVGAVVVGERRLRVAV